jgi:hypothetical protein
MMRSLKEICDKQYFPDHWIRDSAYRLSQKMMYLNEKGTEEWFNYFHSQRRINGVIMAFLIIIVL